MPAELHYIKDDLGEEWPKFTASWLDIAEALLEYEIQERLTAERLMDEIDLMEESCKEVSR